MSDIRVQLTWPEVYLAAHVGSLRNVQSLRDCEPAYGCELDNTWTYNIEGTAGELAVAKHLNLFWSGAIGNRKAHDVGGYQVRTNTSRRLDDMRLHPPDKDDHVFISVLSFLPVFVICGWILARDGKRREWWREGSPKRPCFWVPRRFLRPMAELPVLTKDAA